MRAHPSYLYLKYRFIYIIPCSDFQIKPLGTGIVTGTNWIMVFLITSFKMENVNINFMVSAMFCLLAVLFIWLVVPETRNKSLAAVQAELSGDAPAPTTSA